MNPLGTLSKARFSQDARTSRVRSQKGAVSGMPLEMKRPVETAPFLGLLLFLSESFRRGEREQRAVAVETSGPGLALAAVDDSGLGEGTQTNQAIIFIPVRRKKSRPAFLEIAQEVICTTLPVKTNLRAISETCIFQNLLGAPIAQLDRASDYGSEGYRFNSYWVRH